MLQVQHNANLADVQNPYGGKPLDPPSDSEPLPILSTWSTGIASLGFPKSHCVKVVGFSGRIWVAWYNFVSVDIISNHFQFVHCRVTIKQDGSSVLTTTMYDSLTTSKRKLIWPYFRRLVAFIRSPWILFGDFNATISVTDRKGCASSTTLSRDFQNLVVDYGLHDMSYQGPYFTWSQGLAYARLDCFICNSYWDESYLESTVHHLLRLHSDHRPILLHVDTLIQFTQAADKWNKLVFGYVGTKKRILMNHIRSIQKALASCSSSFLVHLETAF
ncbi:hypothetical protein V6N13_124461 [Hibiscus sabdariffa]